MSGFLEIWSLPQCPHRGLPHWWPAGPPFQFDEREEPEGAAGGAEAEGDPEVEGGMPDGEREVPGWPEDGDVALR
jgi:hypothetical protein